MYGLKSLKLLKSGNLIVEDYIDLRFQYLNVFNSFINIVGLYLQFSY